MTDIMQNEPPRISLRTNIWVVIPIGALIVAILSANLLLLNYVHVFIAVLLTGTDIFMAFLLGPVLQNVSLSTRKEVISWLMPKMVFYMPTVELLQQQLGSSLLQKWVCLLYNHPLFIGSLQS